MPNGVIDQTDQCGKYDELPELVEETSENPLTGDEWDRYKCSCGHTTVMRVAT
jgi:hypothetical protein